MLAFLPRPHKYHQSLSRLSCSPPRRRGVFITGTVPMPPGLPLIPCPFKDPSRLLSLKIIFREVNFNGSARWQHRKGLPRVAKSRRLFVPRKRVPPASAPNMSMAYYFTKNFLELCLICSYLCFFLLSFLFSLSLISSAR